MYMLMYILYTTLSIYIKLHGVVSLFFKFSLSFFIFFLQYFLWNFPSPTRATTELDLWVFRASPQINNIDYILRDQYVVAHHVLGQGIGQTHMARFHCAGAF